ncbi:MAG: 50S ribosomal protein L24 [Parasporobacterium sp.]|nr:50S ribosomal protein L24 [Parasporobacterium sp.]
MATIKIKKGDTVKVIAGAEKGKEGKVLSVDAAKGQVVIEGVHMIKKHMKPGRDSQEGGIISQAGPVAISNVMYVHKGKTTRIGFHVDENGKKVRYAKSTNEDID